MWEVDRVMNQTKGMLDIITPNKVKDIWNTINSEFSTATHKNEATKVPRSTKYISVLEPSNEPLKR